MLGLYKINLTVVQNGPIKSYLKYVQNKEAGVQATFGNVQKKDAFSVWMSALIQLCFLYVGM